MLEIRNVTVTFAKDTVNEKRALDNISLLLNEGDFVTIVGENGAGKSTLFNCISGVVFPDEGSIILAGQDVTYDPVYKRSKVIGRLFQDPLKGTAPKMTVAENLALAYLRASGVKSPFSRINKKDREMFAQRLKQLNMGLEDRLDEPVGLLSGGQRQALTLAMATIVPPKLLLLDEHTAALDPAAARQVLDMTVDIVKKHHITCLMITHNMYQALEVGNRTLVMSDGKIALDIGGTKRSRMTVNDLLQEFHSLSGKQLESDRVLLSRSE
ncbi:MAG: ATP-binding cassette domain-containing protein [Erysipelotrichaceae bacterium]|nr:ATP-binding cassette domain-containing protein [Erysipelotrichaceae bacterium]